MPLVQMVTLPRPRSGLIIHCEQRTAGNRFANDISTNGARLQRLAGWYTQHSCLYEHNTFTTNYYCVAAATQLIQ